VLTLVVTPAALIGIENLRLWRRSSLSLPAFGESRVRLLLFLCSLRSRAPPRPSSKSGREKVGFSLRLAVV
jgi:hypothetical protein